MGYDKYETSSLTPVFIWNTDQNFFSRSKAVTQNPLFYTVHVVFHINVQNVYRIMEKWELYLCNQPPPPKKKKKKKKICTAFCFEIHRAYVECTLHILEGYSIRFLREQIL